MEYQLLETFIVLSEVRNITKCAHLLYKTQPTITKRLQQLESALGYALLVREKGKQEIELTPRGIVFLEKAKELYNFYNELSLSSQETANSLLISCIASFQTPFIANVCLQMNQELGTHPFVYTYQTHDVYKLIANKQVDLAIVSDVRNEPGVACEQLFSQPYFVVKYCENPTSEIPLISTDELDPHYELFGRWDNAFLYWHNRVFKNTPIQMMADSPIINQLWLKNTSYWTIMQECTAYIVSQNMPVQLYRIADPPPDRSCYLLTNRFIDKSIRPLISYFKEQFLIEINKYKINSLFPK